MNLRQAMHWFWKLDNAPLVVHKQASVRESGHDDVNALALGDLTTLTWGNRTFKFISDNSLTGLPIKLDDTTKQSQQLANHIVAINHEYPYHLVSSGDSDVQLKIVVLEYRIETLLRYDVTKYDNSLLKQFALDVDYRLRWPLFFKQLQTPIHQILKSDGTRSQKLVQLQSLYLKHSKWYLHDFIQQNFQEEMDVATSVNFKIVNDKKWLKLILQEALPIQRLIDETMQQAKTPFQVAELAYVSADMIVNQLALGLNPTIQTLNWVLDVAQHQMVNLGFVDKHFNPYLGQRQTLIDTDLAKTCTYTNDTKMDAYLKILAIYQSYLKS